MKPKAAPIAQEREFHLHELFFSTTDKKGIVRSGNDVFVRVSGYSKADILGQPHNIIRHPDMPRVVFKLLWDYLKADKSIVAYVKNMAIDGRYYWVVALVTPLNDGYLSIRFKPSSELFPLVNGLYQQLVALENNLILAGKKPKEAMEMAGEKLLEALREKGFESYDAFMHLMLREELKSRETLLRAQADERSPRPSSKNVDARDDRTTRLRRISNHSEQIARTLGELFSKLDDFVLLGSKLEGKVDFISDMAQSMRILSLNTGIASSHLAVEREVLTSIANLMGDNSKHLSTNVQSMGQRLLNVGALLKGVAYDLAAARLQLEMLQTFLYELLARMSHDEDRLAQNSDPQVVPNILTLQNTFMQTYKQAVSAFQKIESDLQRLSREGTELQRSVQTLQFVHLVGRVEISRRVQLAGLGKIMEEVLGKIENMRNLLTDLSEAVAFLFREVNNLGQVDRRVSASLQAMNSDTQLLEAELVARA